MLCAACAAAALLAGCSSTAGRRPVPYAIELVAEAGVNPDANGRPSPIQITLYELSSSAAFESQDFFTLQGNAQAALGKELLNTESVTLRPGETRRVSQPGSVAATVVGVVAAYRDLENSRWRMVVPLPEPQNTNVYKVWQFSPNEEVVSVSVGDKGLDIVGRDRSWWPFW